MDKNVILRKLPRVDDLLKEESLRELCMIYGKKEVLRAVRRNWTVCGGRYCLSHGQTLVEMKLGKRRNMTA